MDIGNKVFAIEKKGYSVAQVDSYLKTIAVEVKKQEKAIADLDAKIQELNVQIEEYKVNESAIKDVLLAAHKTADSMVEEAREQSALIEKQARLEYSRITEVTEELQDGFWEYQKRLIEYVEKQKEWLLEFSDPVYDNKAKGEDDEYEYEDDEEDEEDEDAYEAFVAKFKIGTSIEPEPAEERNPEQNFEAEKNTEPIYKLQIEDKPEPENKFTSNYQFGQNKFEDINNTEPQSKIEPVYEDELNKFEPAKKPEPTYRIQMDEKPQPEYKVKEDSLEGLQEDRPEGPAANSGSNYKYASDIKLESGYKFGMDKPGEGKVVLD